MHLNATLVARSLCVSIAAVALSLGPVAGAEGAGLPVHLPEQAFGPTTYLVAHLRADRLTGERLKEALQAILPQEMFQQLAKEDPKKPGTLQQVKGLEEGLLLSLRSAHSSAFMLLSHGTDGSVNSSSARWMVPATGAAGDEARRSQEEHLKKFAAGLGMQIYPAGASWWGIAKALPAQGGGELEMLDDATFHQGLDHLAKFDFAVVVVPTEPMVKRILEEAGKSAKDAAVEKAAKMLPTVAWYGFGLSLGREPHATLTLAMTSTEAVATLEGVFQAGLDRSKVELAKDVEAYNKEADAYNLDPAHTPKRDRLDPAGVDRLFSALARDAKDVYWSLDLPTQELKGLADGLQVFGTLLASAIADAIVPDLMDSDKAKAQQPQK
ncbi:MAG: hypothetical protein M5U26_11980 [Planctomycetota bacterium]|nr:hypothetical protein [Planctomycetota bacterium]